MLWSESKIEVVFIDIATEQPFGITKMSPEDLPETFELDTTLHLADQDWIVIEATPMTRLQYTASGTLKLRLRRIVPMDPSEVLYSLPSICGAILEFGDEPLSGGEFVIAEDDWRQLEFVSRGLASEVEVEIARIRRILDTAFQQVGWREIHVRSKPEIPIPRGPALCDLEDALDVVDRSTGITVRGAQSKIADGFAFATEGPTIVGLAPKGRVQVLAIDRTSAASNDAKVVDRLASLAADRALDLVDWCRCARVAPDDPRFSELLTGNPSPELP